jgi:ribose-phosphate pyrophosphokinase
MQTNSQDFVVFTGNANSALAAEIAKHLGTTLGAVDVGRFSDGEVTVEIKQSVRARDVFVVQPTCAPTNENLMELLIMVDALKRASAERITAVIPYFGYARQDRRPRSTRVPISAKVVANMLQAVGVARVLTMDLHADQIQGFFDIPVDNIYASPVLLGDLNQKKYRTWWSSAPTSVAWCAHAHWPSSLAATWPSSTSAGPRRMCPRSCMSSATSKAATA